MCELGVVEGVLRCALKDVTGSILGVDLGVDRSGRYVYYVAGAPATPGLYLSDLLTGERRLVAQLDPGDAPDWEAGAEHLDLGELTSRVSGNGRFVAFMSDRSLTGYDNLDASSGQPDEEVYLYDRTADTLRCVSCDPTGARPAGVLDPPTDRTLPLLVDRPAVWHGRWLAGSLPGWPKLDVEHGLYGRGTWMTAVACSSTAPMRWCPRTRTARRTCTSSSPRVSGAAGWRRAASA